MYIDSTFFMVHLRDRLGLCSRYYVSEPRTSFWYGRCHLLICNKIFIENKTITRDYLRLDWFPVVRWYVGPDE